MVKQIISTALFFLFRFQDDINCLNDFLAGICLAVNDDVVNAVLGTLYVDGVLLGQPIVPAAVPDTQKVGVFLVPASCAQVRA